MSGGPYAGAGGPACGLGVGLGLGLGGGGGGEGLAVGSTRGGGSSGGGSGSSGTSTGSGSGGWGVGSGCCSLASSIGSSGAAGGASETLRASKVTTGVGSGSSPARFQPSVSKSAMITISASRVAAIPAKRCLSESPSVPLWAYPIVAWSAGVDADWDKRELYREVGDERAILSAPCAVMNHLLRGQFDTKRSA